MTRLSEIIKYFLIGMGFGSFFLVAIQLTYQTTVDISREEFVIVILASGLVGWYSYLLHTDKINFLIAGILHFCLTLGTVLMVAYLFYHVKIWQEYLVIVLFFLPVYLIVWLIVLMFTNYEIGKVNKKLSQRQKDRD